MLGIDTQINCLRTTKNYLYMLARVVYYIRVLAIKKLLLVVKRDKEIEKDRDAFLELRKKYLANGSYSLISAILSLLIYSKHVALNKSNASNTY